MPKSFAHESMPTEPFSVRPWQRILSDLLEVIFFEVSKEMRRHSLKSWRVEENSSLNMSR